MSKPFLRREFTNHRNIPQIDYSKVNQIFSQINTLDINELRILSTTYQIPYGVVDENGDTLIHKIIEDKTLQKNEMNKLNIIKFLVNNNVNPDLPNKNNITPLHLSCINQNELITEYLLSIDVNPNYQDNLGNSPFHYYLNGLVVPYKDTSVKDLIIPPNPRSDPKYFDLKEISKKIWNQLKEKPGITSIKKTIPVTFILNNEIKDILNKFLDETTSDKNYEKYDIKTYKEKSIVIYQSIQSKLKSDTYWNDFKDIGLKLDREKNSFTDFESVFDECKDKIFTSIDSISNSYENLIVKENINFDDSCSTIFNSLSVDKSENFVNTLYYDYDLSNTLKTLEKRYPGPEPEGKFYKTRGSRITDISDNYISNLKKVNDDKFMFLTNLLNDNFKFEKCIDSADNYIDLDKKTFIGGSRKIDLQNTDINFNDICRIFAQDFELTKLSDLSALQNPDIKIDLDTKPVEQLIYQDLYTNENKFKLPENILDNLKIQKNKKIIKITPALKNSYQFNSYKLNKKYVSNNNLDDFHAVYNWINKIKCDNSRLNVPLETHTLYYLAGHINYNPEGNNRSLSLTQSMKALFLKQIYQKLTEPDNEEKTYKFLSYWLYFLLSDKKFNELCNDLKKFNGNIIAELDGENKPEAIIAKTCYQILSNQRFDENKLKSITEGKIYINKFEWLILAISMYYDKMKQKPLNNHIVDTIFIIRKIEDYEEKNVANFYLKITYYLQSIDILYNGIIDHTNWFPNIQTNSFLEKEIINDNKFNFINTISDTVLPSKRFIAIQLNEINNNSGLSDGDRNSTLDYYCSKFTEAYLLGLNFIDCFPAVSNLDRTNSYSKEITDVYNLNGDINDLTSKTQFYKVNKNKLNAGGNNKNTLPFLGYVGRQNNNDINLKSVTENNLLPEDSGYFDLFGIKKSEVYSRFRPSTNLGLNIIHYRFTKRLESYLKKIIVNSTFLRILESYKKKIDGRKSLGKIIPILYPILLSLLDISKKIDYVFSDIDEDVDKINMTGNVNFFIRNLIDNVNSINAYYFINYYLNTPDNETVDIPSFFYYKIPLSDSQEKSYIYDYQDIDLSLKDNYNQVGGSNFEKIEDLKDKENKEDTGIISKNLATNPDEKKEFNYNYIDAILEGKKYISHVTIKKYMKFSKKAPLPPSLKNHYYDFYKIMLLDIIKKFDDTTIFNDMKNLKQLFKKDEEDSNLTIKFETGKLIENIVKTYFNYFIKSSIFNMLKEKFSDIEPQNLEIDNLFEEREFTVTLDNKYSKFPIASYNPKEESKYINFYRINERINEEDKFLLYSNDYTSNNLDRSFYEFEIKDAILLKMLEKSANPYLKNNENSTAIFSILRNYYHPIFDKLDSYTISYNFTSIPNAETESPTINLFNELKNNSNRLINNSNNYSEILNKFSFTQHNQIKLFGERFGNNVLRNMELSYSIIGYIFNQYLFRCIFKTNENFGEKEITKILELNNITDISNNSYPIMEKTDDVKMSSYATLLQEIKDDLNKKNNEFEKNISNLQNDIIIQNKYSSSSKLSQEKLDKLRRDKILLNNQLHNIDFILSNRNINKTMKKLDNTQDMTIVGFYDELLKENNYNRASYILLWKKFLEESNIVNKKDFNLILINQTYNILSKINDEKEPRLHHLEYLKENNLFYNHIEKLGDKYFKTPKFLDDNEMLNDIKNILKHMTQNIICFGFEVSLKKCLFEYFSIKFGDDDVDLITSAVDSMFNTSLKMDNESMLNILYDDIAEKLVINSINLFKNKSEELEHETISAKEIFDNYIKMFQVSEIQIENNSKFMSNIGILINFYDTISYNIINNWLALIENYLKFSINQSRIIKTFKSLNPSF